MHIFPKIIIGLLVHCFIGIWLSSCSDADKFYDKLDTQPEVIANLEEVYSIGDTLILRGRLNPENGLQVSIGGIDAPLFDIGSYESQTNGDGMILDEVKVLITETMGIGENRPVTLTSAGITISASGIEIVGDANAAILDTQMQLIKVADIPSGAIPLYCHSGNGNVYTFNSTSKKLFKINATDGSINEVFNESACTDTKGAFTFEEFNAGAVSPDEKYFYFSAKVKESGQSRTLELYKFCRYDLQNSTLATLNRTEYSMLQSRRTPEAVQPFEGKADQVKMYKITAIYPDSEGNVYCDLMGHFLTLLDRDLNYSYLLSITANLGTSFETSFIPLINSAGSNIYYSSVQIHQLFPGAKLKYNISYLDTEAKRLYSKKQGSGGIISLAVIDLPTRILTGEYTSNFRSDVAYVTASLKRFNGGLVNNSGFDPLPLDGKLYGVFFTDANSDINGLPATCVIDLENKKVVRLAPGKLLYNDFSIAEHADRLINYATDEQGRITLYLTANTRKVIVKTAFVE